MDPISKLLGTWSKEIGVWSVVLRLALAVVFSAVIGMERSSKRHAAGLRTYIVVGVAATAATILDCFLMYLFSITIPVISAAALIGVAILSGNSVLFSSKSQIKGLTTSVGLWACGIMGMAFGAGFYTLGIIGFAVLLVCLILFPPFETYLKNRSNHFEIQLELKSRNNLKEFVETMRRLGLKIDDIELNPSYANSGLSVYTIALTVVGEELKKYKTHREIIEAISTIDYVCHVEEFQ